MFYLFISDFNRKIMTWTGIQNSDFLISCLALYPMSYPGCRYNELAYDRDHGRFFVNVAFNFKIK
jgi:hypothetical protein